MIANIQIALYQTLINNAQLAGLLADGVDIAGQPTGLPAIYDRVPQPVLAGDDGVFPYVTIGNIQANEFDTDTSNGFDCEVLLYCYSRAGGRLQSRQIQDALYALLHKQDISVNNADAIMMQQVFSRVDLEPDGKTYQGVSSYRFVIDNVL